jgi:uncharacterized protein (DUF433 family)
MNLSRITIVPDVCGGRPTIRGMRITVTDVLELLAGGMSHAEILKDYPYLEDEDIRECLHYAALLSSYRNIESSAA